MLDRPDVVALPYREEEEDLLQLRIARRYKILYVAKA
jgi:hypothetical protein